MMKFREFLIEKPMDFRSFGDIEKRLGQVAKVGFEFEMLITPNSPLYVEPTEKERDTINVSFLDTLDSFKRFFVIDRYTELDIVGDFERWIDNAIEEYAQEHFGDLTPRKARQKAVGVFNFNEHRFEHWIKNVFKTNLKFISFYDLKPINGWYNDSPRTGLFYTDANDANDDDDEKNFLETFYAVEDSLKKIINTPIIIVDEYHGIPNKSTTNWYIEPDESIKGIGFPVEIVSPPMPLDEASGVLTKIFDWMTANKVETNNSTGLHVNISLPGIKDIDVVKLVLMLGEDYAAQMFNRLNNKFASSQVKTITPRLLYREKLPTEANERIKAAATQLLFSHRYHLINLKTLNKGYIEFRAAGNAGYEKDVEKVKKLMYRCIVAIESACDPHADRQEYLKKLSRLYDGAKMLAQDASISPRTSSIIPAPLHRIARIGYITDDYMKFRESMLSDDKSIIKNETIHFIAVCVSHVKSINSYLDLKERIFLKGLMKRYGVTKNDVDRYHNDNDEYDRSLFKQEIGI